MAKRNFGILLYRWHSWVGLISGLFLLVICVTGTVAVFRPEIERAVDWGGYDFVVTPTPAGPITLERAIATAEAAYPGSEAREARYPDFGGSWQSHGETYSVVLAKAVKGKGTLNVLVDPYQDKVVAAMAPNRGWGDWLRQLHVRFLYGSYWGRWVVGFFGLVLVFSTVSGLMIFTRFNAGSWRPKLRHNRGARIALADWHKLVGLGSVAFNIVFGVTGAVIGLEGLYRKYAMERPAPEVRLAGVKELPAGMIERCVERSRELIPGGTVAGVTLGHERSGVIRVRVETPVRHLVKEGGSSVAFSAKTGEPIEVYDARQASLAGRLYYSMEPLHFGRLGGYLWVKVLWGLMGLSGGFLSITGFAIYVLRKRKAAAAKAKSKKAAPESAGQDPWLVPAAGAATSRDG